ncbi:MAG TPA: FAD-binding oxidoreductase [Gammaproteobacteria bacterium]
MQLEQLIDELRTRFGAAAVLTGSDVSARPAGWRGPPSEAAAIVRPANTAEVAEVLRLCHAAGLPVVTHGGRTGVVGGAVSGPGEIALSLERLTAIEEVDVANRTLTVQAGVPLQLVQERADAEGLLFPQDLGARGSATIGGMVATNAGGNRVIRFGMMRDMVLGLEAVLADGTVVSSLHKVIKNNSGYDLRQLFVGSEGTLGVVTRVVLRLRPKPRSQNTALLAVPDFAAVTRLLSELEAGLGGQLSVFEVMWNAYYALSAPTAWQGRAAPLAAGSSAFYALVEALGGDADGDAERFAQVLAAAHAKGLVGEAVIARSEQERQNLWAVRDNVECLHELDPVFLFDVSLPIGDMHGYVDELEQQLGARWPDHQLVVFGHLGDCNLHVVVAVGDGSETARGLVEEVIYGGIERRGGSISAEHGIGIEKRDHLHHSRSPAELALMRALKSTLDPRGILNPGKVLAPTG